MKHPYAFVFVLLIALLGGCRATECTQEEVLPEENWQRHAGFDTYFASINNLYATDDNLFAYGLGFIGSISREGDVTKYLRRNDNPPLNRMPITEKYFTYLYRDSQRNEVSLVWVLTQHQQTKVSYRFSADFANVAFWHWGLNTISFNNADQCLVPVITRSAEPELYLFSLSSDYPHHILLADTIRIPLHQNSSGPAPISIYFTQAYNDYFIVGHSEGVLKVYPDGNYRKVISQDLYNMFRYQNRLYGQGEMDRIYISEDEGETWTLQQGLPRDFILGHFYTIGDSLVLSRHSQLFSVQNDGGPQWHVRELNSEGLEGLAVTGVVPFGDQVYVSSYSGLYHKSLARFFDSKAAE